jgi:hypothetical protein
MFRSQTANLFNRRRKVPVAARFHNRNLQFAFCILQFSIFAFFSITGPSLFAAQPRFTTSLDRDSVIVGESVVLTLKFEGISPSGMPQIPAIPGLQMAGGVSSAVNSVLTPDGMTSTTSYSVNLIAQHTGDIVIPVLTIDIGGQRLQSQPLHLKVAQNDPNAPQQDLGDRLAFLSLSLPKKELFVGEVLPVELHLYLRGDVLNPGNLQLPPLRGDGFTSGKFVQGERFARQVGNNQFMVIPLLTTLTPVKDGQLTLDALNGSIIVYRRAAGRRQANPFDIDSFFGPPMEQQQVPLSVQQQTINVRPLPSENVPAGFNGAVGNYTMTFSAGPTNVAVGDPITVKVQISGHGNLDAVNIPEQPAWRDFKTYPPTTRVETHDQLGVQGTKFFEQIIVPQNSDIKTLPALSFSYFDPDQKAYRILSQPAVALMVRPSASAPPPTVAMPAKTSQENPALAQDIVEIKRQFGPLAQVSIPFVVQPWFLALQGVPMLAWVSLLVWRRRTDNLANNPKLRRQRHVAQIVRGGLNELRRHAAANDSDQFFATLSHLLQEQLGERLDLPASAITEAVVEEYLVPGGVPEAILTPLGELFQTCNLARYAPIKSSQQLAALIPKTESVLHSLQEVHL